MNKKTVILLVLLASLLLFGGIGAGFYFMWTQLSTLKTDKAPAETEETAEEPAEQVPQMGPIFPLDTFIVNLGDPDRAYYLKITMSLELDGELVQEEVEKRLPQIRDRILTVLPTKSSEELVTAEGKQALRESVIADINALLQTGAVRNLYFTDFVIQ